MAQTTQLSPLGVMGRAYDFSPGIELGSSAISHDSTTTASSASTATLNITSHTVTGTDPVLVVKIALQSSSATVNTVKWDTAGVNESLTQLLTARSSNALSELWFLANPTAKTATVEIKLSSLRAIIGAASTYAGVDQTNPFRNAAKDSATGNNNRPFVFIFSLNGEMVVDSLAQASDGPDTAIPDHQQRHNIGQVHTFDDIRGASQEFESSGGKGIMGWDMSGFEDWSICAAPLQVPQGAGFVPYPRPRGLRAGMEQLTGGFH